MKEITFFEFFLENIDILNAQSLPYKPKEIFYNVFRKNLKLKIYLGGSPFPGGTPRKGGCVRYL